MKTTNMNYCPHLVELDGACALSNFGLSCESIRGAGECSTGAIPGSTVQPYYNSKMRKAGYPKRT